MRISDWSSDVCSSDLAHQHPVAQGGETQVERREQVRVGRGVGHAGVRWRTERATMPGKPAGGNPRVRFGRRQRMGTAVPRTTIPPPAGMSTCSRLRSEEHTSELQSLMRFLSAVFCLKKKTINIPIRT